jgi:ferredoxin
MKQGGCIMQVLAKGKVESVLTRLAENAEVFIPMQRGPQTGFFSWKTFDEDHDDLMLDILNVYLPPKNIVWPASGKLQDSDAEAAVPAQIIFGIRGCDVQGIDYLDDILLTWNDLYKARREKTIIIASACYYPGKGCFCTSTGGEPTEVASADVIIRDAGREGYVWESKTDKGQLVTDRIADFLEEKQVVLPETKPLERTVDFSGAAEKLRNMFDHPIWEKHSDPCQTCGICTFNCPTCYCFDHQVKNWEEEGYEFRCYHSCMYRPETLLASRQNPSESALERFRNRFLHKLGFYPQKYGKPLCTGCGRCTALCPAGYGMFEMMGKIMEADD